jgi:hypothetical protein
MQRLGMPISDDTILRHLKRNAASTNNEAPARIVGIDDCSAPWGITPWQRIRVSSRFAGVGEIIAQLKVALVDFEARPIDFNNLVTVHVFDLRRFPTHL